MSNTVALNCMTFPYDSIKCGQPCYKAMSSVSFALVDFFEFLGDLQPLPQPPLGWKEAHKRDVGGCLYPFTRLAVAHHDGGILTHSCGDLMEERRWLMRSDSPLGDAGLPSSKRMAVLSPLGNLPRFLYHMCSPDPLPKAPRSLLVLLWCSLKCTQQADCKTYFILFLKEE